MAIGFGTASGALATSTGGTLAPTLPSSTAVGDLLLAHISHGDTSTIATPAGWGLAVSGQNAGATHRGHLFWRFAQAGETDPSFTTTTTNGSWGMLTRFTGVPVSVNPFNSGGAGVATQGSGTTLTGTAMTSTVNNCMAIWAWTQSDNGTTSGNDNGTSDAYIGASYSSVVGIDTNVCMVYKMITTAGATGTTTVASSSGVDWIGLRVLLDPTQVSPVPPLLRPEQVRVRHLLPR